MKDWSNRIGLPAVTLAFLLSTPTATATPLQGTFLTGSLDATDLHALQAPLVAFVQSDDANPARVTDTATQPADPPPRSDPGFLLSARSIHLVNYSADRVHYAGINGPVERSQSSYSNATVNGLDVRLYYSLSAFPSLPKGAAVQVESRCSALHPSTEDQIRRESNLHFEGPDNTVIRPVSDALSWTGCFGSGALTVQGDFLLMLWEWDAVLHADGREVFLPSGRTRWEQDPGAPTNTVETRNVVSKDVQRYLYVQDGTLTVPTPNPDEATYKLYVGPQARLQASQVRLSDTVGRIQVDERAIDLHSSAAQLQGNLVLEASGTGVGRPILGHLQGDVQGASVDGTPLSLDTQGADPVSPDARLLGTAAGVLLLALGVSCTLWGRRPAATLAVACSRGAYALGGRRLASGWADLAARLDPRLPAARLARARALTALLRYEEALEDHASLDRLLTGRSQRARNAVEAARTLAAMDRARDALAWLFRARQCDAEVFYPAVGDPDFRGLRTEPWFLVQLQDRAYHSGGFSPTDCYSRRRAGNAQSLGLGGDTSASLP